jgi:hypothetical protein
MATYKSVGAVALGTGGTVNVPQPALVSGDVAVLWAYAASSQTPLTVPGYTLIQVHNLSDGGSFQGFWRRATGTIAATNVAVSISSPVMFKIGVVSGAADAAPVMLAPNIYYGQYLQTPAISAAPRVAISFGFINAARTQGALSNQGSLTSTNASRGYETPAAPFDSFRISTFSSVITAASGGAVRQTFTGGDTDTLTTSFLFADAPPAAPTGLALTAGDRKLGVSFTPTAGATQSKRRWRRSLTRPTAVTQASAPAHLRRISQEALPMPSGYTYDFDGTGARLYVLDTGIRATHQDFSGRVRTGSSVAAPWNQDTAENPPFPNGHGTGVAAMALGTVHGVAKGAIVVSVNAGPEAGPSAAQYQEALAFIQADKVPGQTVVVNISNGLPADDTERNNFLQGLKAAGCVVVVAVIPDPAVVIPEGVLDGVGLLVGSSTQADAKASYSAYGPGISVYAPISPTVTASSASDTATRTADGTSEATPTVAGVALKILQANPTLGPERVYEVITSQAWTNKISGAGTGYDNRLLNGNANTDQWSELPLNSGDELTQLENGVTYEVQVASLVGGVWSDWSTSQSATPQSVPVTGSISAALPESAVAVPQSAWTATGAVPTYAATLAADLPVAVAAPPAVVWAGAFVGSAAGQLAAELPAVAAAVAAALGGTATVPQGAAVLVAALPETAVATPGAAWAGAAIEPTPAVPGILLGTTPAILIGVLASSWTGVTQEDEVTVIDDLNSLLSSLPGYGLLTLRMKEDALAQSVIPDGAGVYPGQPLYQPTYDVYWAALRLIGFLQAQPVIRQTSSEGTSIAVDAPAWGNLIAYYSSMSLIAQVTQGAVLSSIPIPGGPHVRRTNMHVWGDPSENVDTDLA